MPTLCKHTTPAILYFQVVPSPVSKGVPPELSDGRPDAVALLIAEDELLFVSDADVFVPLLDNERTLGVYTVLMLPEDEGDREVSAFPVAVVLEISVDDMIAIALQFAGK